MSGVRRLTRSLLASRFRQTRVRSVHGRSQLLGDLPIDREMRAERFNYQLEMLWIIGRAIMRQSFARHRRLSVNGAYCSSPPTYQLTISRTWTGKTFQRGWVPEAHQPPRRRQDPLALSPAGRRALVDTGWVGCETHLASRPAENLAPGGDQVPSPPHPKGVSMVLEDFDEPPARLDGQVALVTGGGRGIGG